MLGLELAGEVAACPDGSFAVGQRCCAVTGGLGRQIDGGYTAFALVPTSIVNPLASALEWSILDALPETFQTAMGCLTTGLDCRPQQTILIRGGALLLCSA